VVADAVNSISSGEQNGETKTKNLKCKLYNKVLALFVNKKSGNTSVNDAPPDSAMG
jgi:hypothetical protein